MNNWIKRNQTMRKIFLHKQRVDLSTKPGKRDDYLVKSLSFSYLLSRHFQVSTPTIFFRCLAFIRIKNKTLMDRSLVLSILQSYVDKCDWTYKALALPTWGKSAWWGSLAWWGERAAWWSPSSWCQSGGSSSCRRVQSRPGTGEIRFNIIKLSGNYKHLPDYDWC